MIIRDAFLAWRLAGVPGPSGLPIVGHIPWLLSAPWDRFGEWARKHGDVYKM